MFSLADYLVLSTLHRLVVESLSTFRQLLTTLVEKSPTEKVILGWNKVSDYVTCLVKIN